MKAIKTTVLLIAIVLTTVIVTNVAYLAFIGLQSVKAVCEHDNVELVKYCGRVNNEIERTVSINGDECTYTYTSSTYRYVAADEDGNLGYYAVNVDSAKRYFYETH